jgi:hypothetical protein
MPFLDCSCPSPAHVLAKAVLTAAEMLGLKQADLAAILGAHKSSFGRLGHAPNIDPASEIGERALLLVRLARALSALSGGDKVWISHFMQVPNVVTGGVPVQQIITASGLVSVVQFTETLSRR